MTMKKLLIFLFLAIAGICDTKAQYTIADNNHISDRKLVVNYCRSLYYFIGCSVRCSEKQMLKSPVKLLI